MKKIKEVLTLKVTWYKQIQNASNILKRQRRNQICHRQIAIDLRQDYNKIFINERVEGGGISVNDRLIDKQL